MMIKTNELNQIDQLLEDVTEYVLNKEITSVEALRHRPLCTIRYAWLRDPSFKLSRMHEADGPNCARNHCSERF